MFQRLPIHIYPDKKRVVCFPYNLENEKTIKRIYEDVLSLEPDIVKKTYNRILEEFSHRHKSFLTLLKVTCQSIDKVIPAMSEIMSDTQKNVLASYFLKEFSVEVAALFNPSLVVHPVQDNPGKTKIVMSLRATGEGHISSIEFAEGYVDEKGIMELIPRKQSCALPLLKTAEVERSELEFASDLSLDEQVIFPLTPDESNGIEDVRFVLFTDEHGQTTYYGSFTAFNGREIKSKLITTNDFKKFSICSMNGAAINDKGMALFPKKISGKYAMISRQDGENIRIMFSDNLLLWDKSEILQVPEFSWQFAKIGNCGSPIETDHGWLLLTHGVGPVRKYTMGALLLDKKDPRKVIAQTQEPFLEAQGDEREGYVPNVVYSCGGLLLKKQLFVPFAVSDISSSIVSVDIDELLGSMI